MSYGSSLLSAEQQGDLVISCLNLLPHPEDLAEGDTTRRGQMAQEMRCCPDCCAPCGVLKELVDGERIDDAVMESRIFDAETTWAWWVPGEGVNRGWLADVWRRCQSEVPGHADGNGGVHPPHDD